MYADDRVLVGVVNRAIDFEIARRHNWYRIPEKQLPRGLNAEYIAFFLSGKPFKERSGSVAYFARITGLELARRRDLLPAEARRADEIYYKVQFRQLLPKEPPIRNLPSRSISFIRTTWDRFISAETISDLYQKGDFFVDRVYHALRN
ncbi:MAG: hypothetical protein OXI34_10655 [Chloroflexota bacterium]|nr:hypothetical protein [Chloroflexota bacterium]MDE2853265.1 hypothetical protein [Chloroflexota bacterium]MDE2948172.1 hypothetical protein [Chloroflexota bacterium]